MYRPRLNNRDKTGAVAGVIAIHAGLLFAFLHLSGRIDIPAATREITQVFDVTEIPPPPPEPPVVEQKVREKEVEKPKEDEGAASPENIRSKATPIVAPKPKVQIPVKPPVAVTQTPNQGAAPTQGAGTRPGPGTGGGGTGTGTGSGGSGSGTGGGGEGPAVQRTRLATRPLGNRDFPPELLAAWPRGAGALMRFKVSADGYIMECHLDQGTGVASIDSQICNIAKQRLRFRPGIDRQGRRVVDWFAYGQRPVG